jgi:hypothetical protein
MDIAKAKEYFELGLITGFYSVRDLEPGSWVLCIEGSDGRSWDLKTAKGQMKTFRSLDTLAGEIESISGRLSAIRFKV